jgi:chorismate mutase/prephenate dehydratase
MADAHTRTEDSSPPTTGADQAYAGREATLDERLAPLRMQIDRLDAHMLDLLQQRARLAQQVGEVKQQMHAPAFRPEREQQVIASLAARAAGGPLAAAAIAAIWREIMSACRSLEQRAVVAFLGPLGTFSEDAARRFFGSSVDFEPCSSIDEVFVSVQSEGADFGVVPIENSSEGAIARTMDLLLQTPLTLCGEVSLPVRHNLLRAVPELEGIRAVCAHGQALAQCHRWLSEHLPGVERRTVSSNAEGARLAAADPSFAALASERAAQQYGLHLVARAVQDDPNNRTRFGVVGRIQTQPSGRDRSSLILSVPNRAGAVFDMLRPLAEHGVSMTRFESRPARSGGSWEYYFYVDVEGHHLDPRVAAALADLQRVCAYYKLVGSYPQAA